MCGSFRRRFRDEERGRGEWYLLSRCDEGSFFTSAYEFLIVCLVDVYGGLETTFIRLMSVCLEVDARSLDCGV